MVNFVGDSVEHLVHVGEDARLAILEGQDLLAPLPKFIDLNADRDILRLHIMVGDLLDFVGAQGRRDSNPAESGEGLLPFTVWLRLLVILRVLCNDHIFELEPGVNGVLVGACNFCMLLLLWVARLEDNHQVLRDVGVEVAIDFNVLVDALQVGDILFEDLRFEVHRVKY